jgi:hypothetical protein
MPLDIALGILLSLGVAEYFSIEATPLLIAFGIAAALLPDIDIITIPLLGKWYHRTYTHYPLLYLPLIVLSFLLFPTPYAVLFTLCILMHFIHDSIGIGWWGIAWLWPFSQRRFLFFPEKERRDQLGGKNSWIPEEEPPPRDPIDQGRWIAHFYLRPSKVAVIEYGVLLLSLIVLILYFS